MTGRVCKLGAILASALILPAGTAQDPGIPAPLKAAPLRPFLKKHCNDCHADGAAKGGLRLDELSSDLRDPETMRKWVRVHDRVKAGEMPPKKKARPSAPELEPFLRHLEQSLTRADRVRREVFLRRLNRTEYENTVRTLFGIHVDVKNLLPEDVSAHGFDNVGEALASSSELIQAYLEAADKTLDAVYGPARKPKQIKMRFPILQDVERHIGNLFRKTPDGVAMFHSGYSPSAIRSMRVRDAGTYRIRIHAKAFQSKEPVTMSVYAGDVITNRRARHLVGYYDLPTDKMTVIEFEDRFLRYDTFHPKPFGTVGSTREKWKYAGPGIVIGDIEVEGPLEAWPPPSRIRLLGGADPEKGTMKDARAILSRVLARAFRRPTAPEDVEPYAALAEAALKKNRPFIEALRVGLKGILCSPEFLFLEEPVSEGTAAIDDFALASRLSFFFWSTMPDETLMRLAARGELHNPATLRAQTERLLKDPRAEQFTKNFTGQWLDLRDIDFTEPDRKLYPEFDNLLKHSMVQETRRFFAEVLRNDLSLANFVDSDWTILNERLAKHYGIEGVKGQAFRRVKLPDDSVRGGVLTQGSVLKVTANGTNTSPVLRGVWVLKNIVGKPTQPPPPDVPAIEPDIRGATTLRQQLDKHRNSPRCASCHRRIDPPGFALENFDVIGSWRTWYRSLGKGERVNRYVNRHASVRVRYRKGPDVDATGKTEDGRAFSDIREFKKILLEDKDRIARCLAEKLLTYALGRGMGFSDRRAVDAIVAKLRSRNYGFRTLVHDIVQSKTFRNP